MLAHEPEGKGDEVIKAQNWVIRKLESSDSCSASNLIGVLWQMVSPLQASFSLYTNERNELDQFLQLFNTNNIFYYISSQPPSSNCSLSDHLLWSFCGKREFCYCF